MNKNIIVDTSKIKTDVIKELTNMKDNFDKSVTYINKVYDLKCPELFSEMEILKRNLVEHSSNMDNYIKRMNSIIRDFNNLSTEIIKKSSIIEKVNASNIMTKK